MNHQDHVNLLRDGVSPSSSDKPQVWADLGAGAGAFTLALADLIGGSSQIIAVDRDSRALDELQRIMRSMFPNQQLRIQVADFTQPLELANLDGVVMANSLHFVNHKQKEAVLQRVKSYLRPDGRLLLVEYNADQGNMWVPHPMRFETWVGMATHAGFGPTRLIGRVPSRFLGEIYSAVSDVSANK
jgi:ubiquinone/menaquinone biosynthesis C-methylase UbiE